MGILSAKKFCQDFYLYFLQREILGVITPSKLNKKYVMKSVSDAQKKFDPFDKTINSIVFNTLI